MCSEQRPSKKDVYTYTHACPSNSRSCHLHCHLNWQRKVPFTYLSYHTFIWRLDQHHQCQTIQNHNEVAMQVFTKGTSCNTNIFAKQEYSSRLAWDCSIRPIHPAAETASGGTLRSGRRDHPPEREGENKSGCWNPSPN